MCGRSCSSAYAVSADGTLVYVPVRVPQRTLVWVDRRGATEPVPIFPPAGYGTVALSPDGGRVAAVTTEKGHTLALVVGDLARGTISHSTAEGGYQGAVWAPDGKGLAISFGPQRVPGQPPKLNGTFWQSADLSTPPERLTTESARQQEWPMSFSPDGRWLLVDVFSFGDAGGSRSLSLLPLTGDKALHPFVETKSYVGNGRFSPDGRWVAYDSDESDTSKFPEIFVRPFPGPGPKWQVSASGGAGLPFWSRNGRELFYWQNDNKLMAVDVETTPAFHTGPPRVLFQGRFYHDMDCITADVAPDGTRFLMILPDPAEFAGSHVNVVTKWFEEVKAKVAGAKR